MVADADVEALKDLILSTSFKLQINQKFQMRKDTNNANNTFDSGSEGGGGRGRGGGQRFVTGARDERPKGKFERSRARTVQARDRWKEFLSLGSASPDYRVVRCKRFPFPFRHMLSE